MVTPAAAAFSPSPEVFLAGVAVVGLMVGRGLRTWMDRRCAREPVPPAL